MSPDEAWLLQLVLDIVLITDGIAESDVETIVTEGGVGVGRPLCVALASRGLVETLTINAWRMRLAPNQDNGDIVSKCMGLLAAIFGISRGFRLLRVAIKNGLVPLILVCARLGSITPVADTLQDTLHKMITEILAPAGPATVHYHVLVDLANRNVAPADIGSADDFCRRDVFQAWMYFHQLAEVRLKLLSVFDMKNHVSHRACDNVECGIILEKSTLLCCSGCRESLYCSKYCQKLDWRSGHRESCVWHQTSHENFRRDYSSRESAFLRAVIHHDYQSIRPAMCKLLVDAWAVQPDASFFAIFDCRTGSSKVSLTNVTAQTD
ncbi:hypothetical protein DFH06DRAFT_1324878 [Mycena polygramma]|nr:hypothetical protein DFH06DRAFT_1324878 [Mycena polygramma]